MTARILLCAPSAEFKERAEKIWEKDFAEERQGIFQCELECITLTEQFNEKSIEVNAEAIVARGNSVTYFRERFTDLPIVDVPMTGVDMLHTLMKCRKLCPGKPVAVLGTPNFMLDMESYGRILGMDLRICHVLQRADVDDCLRKLKEEGVESIVGGTLTCTRARRMGMTAFEFMSSRASIEQALRLACVAARNALVRQHEVLSYQSMLDYVKEGLVGIDARGKITIFNDYAAQLLKINGPGAIGRDALSVISHAKLREIIASPEDVTDEQVAYEGGEFNVNKFAVTMHDEPVGSILHIQQVAKIRQLEERIRKKAHLRGLTAKYTFDSIAGESRVLRETIEMARIYAQVDSNVLIEGATGTGKEMFAQSIHNSSSRRNAPFVAVNCAAIPESLLESELFGYVEGAFTGARKGGKMGLFELAHNGTIFLDEIYGLPMALQGRLLRVLQEKEIMRIGDDRVIPVNVRVISATNRNLTELIEKGDFRDDLYYRLDVLRLTLPPLRERGDDVLLLAERFIRKFSGEMGMETIRIPEKVRMALMDYAWPGNVRELRNVCERACVLMRSGAVKSDMQAAFPMMAAKKAPVPQMAEDGHFRRSVQDFEKQEIAAALQKFSGNKTRAAEYLGISRATLWKKIRELELE